MSFQHLGLVSFLLLFGGAALIIRKWPLGKHQTVSQHVAANKRLAWCFVLLSAIFLSLFLPFLAHWFIPTFHISIWFSVFVTVASTAQFASALIPEVGGWKTQWHRALAGMTAVSLAPALIVLLSTDAVPMAGKAVTWFCLAVMAIILVLLIKSGGKHSHFLVLQFSYFGAFFVPILFITYML